MTVRGERMERCSASLLELIIVLYDEFQVQIHLILIGQANHSLRVDA